MPETTTISTDRVYVYVILRYTPNLVRNEWVNIGVLLFDPASGERRLRLIEEQEEFARVRRLHPGADEGLLRGLRDDLEDRLHDARHTTEDGDWQKLLAKEPAKARPAVAQQMQHWLQDTDFAGVRGSDALKKLPEGERKDWQRLWQDVETLLKQATDPVKPAAATAVKKN